MGERFVKGHAPKVMVLGDTNTWTPTMLYRREWARRPSGSAESSVPMLTRGTVTQSQLNRVIKSIKGRLEPYEGFAGARFADGIDFAGWDSRCPVDFAGAVFKGESLWATARFRAPVRFDDAQFHGSALFGPGRVSFGEGPACHFDGAVHFVDAHFHATASFRRALFGGRSYWHRTRFGGWASWAEAYFRLRADWSDAIFEDVMSVRAATFDARVQLNAVRFEGPTYFHGALARIPSVRPELSKDEGFANPLSNEPDMPSGRLSLRESEIVASRFLGPFVVHTLVLDDLRADQAVNIEVEAAKISAKGAHFRSGGELRAVRARVQLPECRFGQAFRLVGSSALARRYANEREGERVHEAARAVPECPYSREPRLASLRDLRGADASNLVGTSIDLRGCMVAGAINLDGLRLSSDAT